MRAGDKVRVIARNAVDYGATGAIVGTTFDGKHTVFYDDKTSVGAWWSHELELVTKPAFKVGDPVKVKGCDGRGIVWGVDGGKVQVDLVYRNKRELLWLLTCDLELITDSLKVGDRVRVKDLPHVEWCRGLTGRVNFVSEHSAQVHFDAVRGSGFYRWDELERIEEAKTDEPHTVAKVHVAHMELLTNLTARVTFEGGGSALHHTFPLSVAKDIHLGDKYTITIRKTKPGGA